MGEKLRVRVSLGHSQNAPSLFFSVGLSARLFETLHGVIVRLIGLLMKVLRMSQPYLRNGDDADQVFVLFLIPLKAS